MRAMAKGSEVTVVVSFGDGSFGVEVVVSTAHVGASRRAFLGPEVGLG